MSDTRSRSGGGGGQTWTVVARLMALETRRSRGMLAVLCLFAVVGTAAVVLPAATVGDSLSGPAAVVFLVAPLKVVVALVGLLAGYSAIAGPRTGGQLALLLSLPVSRTALVVGAFAGRGATVLGGVAVGLAVVSGWFAVVYGGLPLGALASFGALLGLLAVAVTGLGVGISAVASSRGRAAVGAVGTFVLLQFFWGVVPTGAYYLVAGSLPGAVVPGWVVLLERLQPLAAFEATAYHALPTVHDAVQLSADGAETAAAGTRSLDERLDGPRPVYLNPWSGVVTLVGWTVVPLAVGWARFRRADL